MASLGHPRKFQRVSRLRFVTASASLDGNQANFARRLAISCACMLYVHFWGLLSLKEFTLRPSLAFSYVGSVIAWHLSSVYRPNFVAWDT